MSAVGNAVDDIVQNARDKLPGSDAKEGPLSDLSDTGPALVQEFVAGIEMNTDELARASRQAAAAAMPPVDVAAVGPATATPPPAAEVGRSPSATPTATTATTDRSADIDEAALGEAIAENMDIDQEIILDAVFDRGATTDSILDEIDDRRTRQTGSSM